MVICEPKSLNNARHKSQCVVRVPKGDNVCSAPPPTLRTIINASQHDKCVVVVVLYIFGVKSSAANNNFP